MTAVSESDKSNQLVTNMQSERLRISKQISSSAAKASYRFSKDQRFKNLRPKYQPPFYDVPTTNQNRATSLGYGKKSQIAGKQARQLPGPGAYLLPDIRKPSYSFGMGREQVKCGSVFQNKKNSPGPAAYGDLAQVKYKKLAFSMGVRLKDKSNDWSAKVPGPGSYRPVGEISKEGNYVLSILQNSGCRKFGTQRRKGLQPNSKVPGPGSYKVIGDLSSGNLIESRFKSNGSVRFLSGQRQSIAGKSITPGPGQYEVASDFHGVK